jgi:hypothetical protein
MGKALEEFCKESENRSTEFIKEIVLNCRNQKEINNDLPK